MWNKVFIFALTNQNVVEDMIDEITIKDMLALSNQYTYACEDFIIVSEAEKVKNGILAGNGEFALMMDAIFLFPNSSFAR